MKKEYRYFVWGAILGGVVCALVCIIFFMVRAGTTTPFSDLTPIRLSRFASTTGALTDPLFAVGNSSIKTPLHWQPLEKSLQTIIQSSITGGEATEVSVYFKDLRQSDGIGINADALYYPASLLKVPLMIAYFKASEKNPELLQQRIVYEGGEDANIQENIRSPIQIRRGQQYSVEELIEHMIKYSDNNAAELLIAHLNTIGESNAFNALFSDLGFKELGTDDYLTPRKYSLFFRVLYNATYLTREDSEKALSLLTKTDFSQGIESGVPNPITIAQKFGEYTVKNTSGVIVKRELHNCGIIYVPEKPYLLCVMTKGKDFAPLESLIASLSRTIYASIETQK